LHLARGRRQYSRDNQIFRRHFRCGVWAVAETGLPSGNSSRQCKCPLQQLSTGGLQQSLSRVGQYCRSIATTTPPKPRPNLRVGAFFSVGRQHISHAGRERVCGGSMFQFRAQRIQGYERAHKQNFLVDLEVCCGRIPRHKVPRNGVFLPKRGEHPPQRPDVSRRYAIASTRARAPAPQNCSTTSALGFSANRTGGRAFPFWS